MDSVAPFERRSPSPAPSGPNRSAFGGGAAQAPNGGFGKCVARLANPATEDVANTSRVAGGARDDRDDPVSASSRADMRKARTRAEAKYGDGDLPDGADLGMCPPPQCAQTPASDGYAGFGQDEQTLDAEVNAARADADEALNLSTIDQGGLDVISGRDGEGERGTAPTENLAFIGDSKFDGRVEAPRATDGDWPIQSPPALSDPPSDAIGAAGDASKPGIVGMEPMTTEIETSAEAAVQTSSADTATKDDGQNPGAGGGTSSGDGRTAPTQGAGPAAAAEGFGRAMTHSAGQTSVGGGEDGASVDRATAVEPDPAGAGDTDAMTILTPGAAQTGGVAAAQPGGPGSAALAASVSRQIAGMVGSRSENAVALLLSPEELGRVAMTLSTHDDGISVALVVDRPETLDLMRRHIDLLTRDLRELGFARVDISFGNSGESSRDAPPSDRAPEFGKKSVTGAGAPIAAPEILRLATATGLDLRL